MRCPDCDVTWNEYVDPNGRKCWACGREYPAPLPPRAWPQWVPPRNYNDREGV